MRAFGLAMFALTDHFGDIMHEIKELRKRYLELLKISTPNELLNKIDSELESLNPEIVSNSNWYVTQLHCMKIDAMLKQESKELDGELESFCKKIQDEVKVLNQIQATHLAHRAIINLDAQKYDLGTELAQEAMKVASASDSLCPTVMDAYKKAIEVAQFLDFQKQQTVRPEE